MIKFLCKKLRTNLRTLNYKNKVMFLVIIFSTKFYYEVDFFADEFLLKRIGFLPDLPPPSLGINVAGV